MSRWLTLLADRIKRQYYETPAGHAVRVNGLELVEARDLCTLLRQSLPVSWDVVVVADHPESDLEVICDIAIQRRNDKSKSRLFIVPSAFVAEAAASLADTDFHDVTEFLKPICDRLYRRLLPDTKELVKEAMSRVPVSKRLDFLCSLPDSDVTTEHCGKEFWRLGLIPDCSPSKESISRNRSCVSKISDSIGLGTSIHQKVEALGLGDSNLKDNLTELLRTSSLVQSKEWLERIGQNVSMTFDRWTFPGKERINLKAIDVLSFRDSKKNKAYAWSGLALEHDSHGNVTLKASIADPKSKVTVRWTTQPLEPTGEVIYEISLETSEPNPVPLPAAGTQRHKANKTQSWSFTPSDLDELEEGRVRVVVRAYSPDTDDFIVGESDEFLLVSDDVEVTEQTAIPLIRSIPDFLLDRAIKTNGIPALTQAQYDGPSSVKIELDERQQKRIPINPLLYSAERMLLLNPNTAGALCLRLPCDVRWNDSQLKFDEELLLQETLSREWWQIRRKLFAKIADGCATRGVVEAVELSELSDDILTYCRAYANAIKNLQEASGNNTNSPQLNCLIHLDSILLKRGDAFVGSLLSPLHPLRLLWHLMHESLIKDWIHTALDPVTKCALPAPDIALELDGGNCPAFLGDEHSLLYHLDSPLFHWPLYISADEQDPHRLAAMIRWALGLGTLEALTLGQEVAAAALSEKLFAYRELHPYVKTLKVTSVNAGDGQFLVKALSNLADRDAKQSANPDSDMSESAFEVRLYGTPPEHQIGSFLDECATRRREPGLPRKLDRLFKPGGNFLQPHLFWAKRDLAELEDETKSELEEAHVSFVMEYFKPDADLVDDDTTDSAGGVSCYGLQTDLAGELSIADDTLTWFRSAKPPEAARVAPHPVNKAYTAELLKVHRAILKGLVKLRNGSEKQWPASKVTIQARQFNLFSRLHRASDWVLTVDRHLGVELFDSPYGGTGELQDNATRYLIDYAPDQIGGTGQQLMISTAWLEEVRGLLLECLRENEYCTQ